MRLLYALSCRIQQHDVIKHDKVPKIIFPGNKNQIFRHSDSALTKPDLRKIFEETASLKATSLPQTSMDFLARVSAV